MTSQKTFVGSASVQDETGDTGLYLMGHRWMDPTLGRFINRDPIGFAGGLNMHVYAGNNPVNFTDAAGLNPDRPSWFVRMVSEVLPTDPISLTSPRINELFSLDLNNFPTNEMIARFGFRRSEGLAGRGRDGIEVLSTYLEVDTMRNSGLHTKNGRAGGRRFPFRSFGLNTILGPLLILPLLTAVAKADPCDIDDIIAQEAVGATPIGMVLAAEPLIAGGGQKLGQLSVKHDRSIRQFIGEVMLDVGFAAGVDLRPSPLVSRGSGPSFGF